MKVLTMLTMISAGFMLSGSTLFAQGGPARQTKPLTLRGRVEVVKVKKFDRSAALIEIKLKMEFVNVGARPIILLRRDPLFPGGALAKNPEDFDAGKLLATDAAWPENSIDPEWTALRSNLDKPRPPEDETFLLLPGQSRAIDTSVRLVVPTDPSKYTSSQKKESLATIQQLSPVWLRVVCEVWPWNVEPLNADRRELKFGHELQKRWQDAGLLWLDEIYSEPMLVDVKTASYEAP